MQAKTAEERIISALSTNTKIQLDHETRCFCGFRFKLPEENIKTAVRVHKESPYYLKLIGRLT